VSVPTDVFFLAFGIPVPDRTQLVNLNFLTCNEPAEGKKRKEKRKRIMCRRLRINVKQTFMRSCDC
jgi:hypothetical protein